MKSLNEVEFRKYFLVVQSIDDVLTVTKQGAVIKVEVVKASVIHTGAPDKARMSRGWTTGDSILFPVKTQIFDEPRLAGPVVIIWCSTP